MNLQQEILINKYGQELIEINFFKDFFSNFNLLEKRDYLSSLLELIFQSKPNDKDIEIAITLSGLKPTFTPCVMIKKGVMNHNLIKLIGLPETELDKVLILLMSLFKVAYQRRFIIEKNNPNKWWYWDLANPLMEDKICEKHLK